jgi:hypothetical protein
MKKVPKQLKFKIIGLLLSLFMHRVADDSSNHSFSSDPRNSVTSEIVFVVVATLDKFQSHGYFY